MAKCDLGTEYSGASCITRQPRDGHEAEDFLRRRSKIALIARPETWQAPG